MKVQRIRGDTGMVYISVLVLKTHLLTHFVSHPVILQQTTLLLSFCADGAADFPHKHAEMSCILRSFRFRPYEDICAPLRRPPSSSVSVGCSVVR